MSICSEVDILCKALCKEIDGDKKPIEADKKPINKKKIVEYVKEYGTISNKEARKYLLSTKVFENGFMNDNYFDVCAEDITNVKTLGIFI